MKIKSILCSLSLALAACSGPSGPTGFTVAGYTAGVNLTTSPTFEASLGIYGPAMSAPSLSALPSILPAPTPAPAPSAKAPVKVAARSKPLPALAEAEPPLPKFYPAGNVPSIVSNGTLGNPIPPQP